MDLIEHTYTIQWVGPMDYEEYREYLRNQETLDSAYFNLYYFEARKDARYKWATYIGIHKNNDGIDRRVNPSHEHLGPFIKEDAKDIKIWIGSFANEKDQKPENVDIVETLFIKAYNDRLTENTKKKGSIPSSSVCVINSYYNTNDEPRSRKSEKQMRFDSVLIYLEESDSFMHGNLSKMKGTK